MIGIGGTGLHGRYAVPAVLQDCIGDMVVHVIEAPLSLEVRVGCIHIPAPVPVPEKGNCHPEKAGTAKAEFRICIEVPDGIAIEGWGVTQPGFVNVGR